MVATGLEIKPGERLPRVSIKRKAFVEYFLQSFNATDAAKRAQFGGDPTQVGSMLIADVRIQSYIDARLKKLAMTSGETLHHVTRIARGSLKPFYNFETNEIDLSSEFAKENFDLIKKIETDTITRTDKDGNVFTTTRTKIELYDKLAALTLFMKHHNLLAQETPPPNSVTNNTMVIQTPEQARAANLDPLLIAQEIQRLAQRWQKDVPPIADVIPQADTLDADTSDDTDAESDTSDDTTE